MLNEIIKGVSMALNTTFGDNYRSYQNDVKQGLKPPCFFIAALKPSLSPLVGRRYMSHNPLDVRFHPKNGGDNAELFRVAGEMMGALEYITLPNGDVIRGTNREFEVVDGVLHFFVTYSTPLIKDTEETPMETLETYVGAKG